MANIFVKPKPLSAGEKQALIGLADARVVPDPQQAFRPLAADGEWKPDTSYWRRRLRDGDVVEVEALAVQQAAAEPTVEKAAAEEPHQDPSHA